MKKLFIAFFLLFALMGCNNKQPDKKDNSSDVLIKKLQSDLEYKAENSTIITDSAFLGFKFGMSIDDVATQTIELEKAGIIQHNDIGYFFEIANSSGEHFKGYLIEKYFNNKLYSSGMYFRDDVGISAFSELSKLYVSKYGEYDIMNEPYEKMYQQIWFRNNVKIYLKVAENASIQYIDMRFEHKKLIADSILEDKKQLELKKRI